MSDNDKSAATNGFSPQFSERELQLLGWAMQSLKSGPPEIDFDKLAAFAGMTNPRSASNAWAKIKTKLMSAAPDGDVPATPKKTPRGRRAAASRPEGDEDDVPVTPKATPRKRGPKKQDIDGETSPKKPARAKETSAEKPVKSEPHGSEDSGMADAIGSNDGQFMAEV